MDFFHLMQNFKINYVLKEQGAILYHTKHWFEKLCFETYHGNIIFL